MDGIDVEVGEWVNVLGILGHVCGTTGSPERGKTSLDVCFRPHQFEGYVFADHRTIAFPFVGVSVVGRLKDPPFDPNGAETRKKPPSF